MPVRHKAQPGRGSRDVKTIGNILGVFGFAAIVAFFIYAEAPALRSTNHPAGSANSNPESDRGIEASIPVNVTSPSSPSDAGSPQDEQQPPPKSLVFHVQVLLKQRGYDPGPIDGIVGAKTKQSIQAFQSSSSLVPNGLVTKELLKRLESPQNNELDVSGKP